MRGERLKKANQIAKKRSGRWPGSDLPLGRYRKWNQTCSCPMCRRPRYKSKGHHKSVNRDKEGGENYGSTTKDRTTDESIIVLRDRQYRIAHNLRDVRPDKSRSRASPLTSNKGSFFSDTITITRRSPDG